METITRVPSADARDQLLILATPGFEVSRGRPLPLGATVVRDGVNFSLFSKHATSVTGEEWPAGPSLNLPAHAVVVLVAR
jgi:hypothetical protein